MRSSVEKSIDRANTMINIIQTIEVLNNNFCDATRTIVLAHLSDGNSNASDFLPRTQEELGFENVFIADKGVEIEINNV